MHKTWRNFFIIMAITVMAAVVALPAELVIDLTKYGIDYQTTLRGPLSERFELKKGLDIQGGMQVVLATDMSEIPADRQEEAIEAAREVILRRVDLFGVAEPVVQPSKAGDDYRLIVELAGVEDPEQALSLIGTTAQLDFRLQNTSSDSAAISSDSASLLNFLSEFEPTGLTGQQLERADVQFDPQTNQPVVGLEFNSEGRDIFADVTENNVGQVMGIFVDGFPLMLPQISVPIVDGRAVITGSFTLEEAKNLAIQLNAGALPVPISVLEQRQVGASLGQASVEQSFRAGLIGLAAVIVFMIAMYGFKGVISGMALIIYSIITVAIYKLANVTLTLPGIAGLLLSIGMAVDANILIFERMKEELRAGKKFAQALELGFGRAWDSIKDANIATIATALILINPLNLSFLNSSGLVRGFGLTLLIGVLISLFTGVVVTRTFLRLFLADPSTAKSQKGSK